MAEKPEDQFNLEEKIAKGKELYARGCRNYYVKRYSEAADDLSDACKFFEDAYGVDGDELGEVFLLYAKALVAVGQEENKLIEVPENEEEDEPAEEDDGEVEAEDKGDEQMEEEGEDKPEEAKATTAKTNGSDPLPGPSGVSTSAAAAAAENGDSNDADEGNGEDDGGNLEVAWEVLQNAAFIFQRQEDKGLSKLIDCYSEMANISMENSNFEIALDDLNRAHSTFNLLEDEDQKEDRILAGIYYRMGLCQTMIKQYDEAMKTFQKASDIFAKMIEVEKAKDQTEETAAKIKDLEETQQEILNKVLETSDVKAEETERVKNELAKLFGINGAAGSSSSDGSGPSGIGGSGSSSSSILKPTEKSPEINKPKPTDISHLIKRKKPDSDGVECSPAKKQSIETSPGEKIAVPIHPAAPADEEIKSDEKVLEETPTVQVVATENGGV